MKKSFSVFAVASLFLSISLSAAPLSIGWEGKATFIPEAPTQINAISDSVTYMYQKKALTQKIASNSGFTVIKLNTVKVLTMVL
ncbi:hypothetical protein [Photobacterium profundum]|uniref:hypothetical protein n=1 Tax=Photobacterium profundum TaxID=74109 RepID=UPI003D11E8F6